VRSGVDSAAPGEPLGAGYGRKAFPVRAPFGVDSMTQQPSDGIDYDKLAIEQIEHFEPDELDGPAADLDRTLDDENPDDRNGG
jgi:hypothetical protein